MVIKNRPKSEFGRSIKQLYDPDVIPIYFPSIVLFQGYQKAWEIWESVPVDSETTVTKNSPPQYVALRKITQWGVLTHQFHADYHTIFMFYSMD